MIKITNTLMAIPAIVPPDIHVGERVLVGCSVIDLEVVSVVDGANIVYRLYLIGSGVCNGGCHDCILCTPTLLRKTLVRKQMNQVEILSLGQLRYLLGTLISSSSYRSSCVFHCSQ